MGAPEAEHHHRKPRGNQPRGYETLGVHRQRGAMVPLLPPLAALKAQEQSAEHGVDGVLMVGNQLGRQRRERPQPACAHKPRNRNALFPEVRKQLNGIAPVWGNRSIATGLAANRTARPKEGEKIDLAGKKRFLVFPNRFKSVRVRKLNLSAPGPREGSLWAAQTLGSAFLRDLVILLRSISYLAISPSLISSVKLPCKFLTSLQHYIGVNNSGVRSWPRQKDTGF